MVVPAPFSGVQVANFNLPTGAITSSTLALASNEEGSSVTAKLDIQSLLVEGTNVLAVEGAF